MMQIASSFSVIEMFTMAQRVEDARSDLHFTFGLLLLVRPGSFNNPPHIEDDLTSMNRVNQNAS